jgi:hypothetical protein
VHSIFLHGLRALLVLITQSRCDLRSFDRRRDVLPGRQLRPGCSRSPVRKRWGQRDVLLRLGSCQHRKQHRRRNRAELKQLLDRISS